MERDWAYLEAAALDLILDKLEERIDHVWFGAVCKNWCSVAKLNHQNQQFISNVVPMLMIPTKTKIRIKRSLYSIPGNRVYPFQLAMLNNKKFCGFSHGWLATVDSKDIVITLTNPFKNVAPIVLPSLGSGYYYHRSDLYLNKVVLSVDPLMNPNDYVVAAIHSQGCSLSFIGAGKEYWTRVQQPNRCYDITFYKGLAYAAVSVRNEMHRRSFDSIMSFNPHHSDDDPYRRKMITSNIFHQDNPSGFHSGRAYLVKSFEGDLWMVRRHRHNQEDVQEGFDVYKLELDAQNGKVLQMLRLENLGNNVLFVHDHSDSTAASSSYFSNCLQKDSVYYTNDNDVGSPIPAAQDPVDLSVYNVKEGRLIQNYPVNPSFTRVSRSLWILPPFQWD